MYTVAYKWFSMSPKIVYLQNLFQHFAHGLDKWTKFTENWKLRFTSFMVIAMVMSIFGTYLVVSSPFHSQSSTILYHVARM